MTKKRRWHHLQKTDDPNQSVPRIRMLCPRWQASPFSGPFNPCLISRICGVLFFLLFYFFFFFFVSRDATFFKYLLRILFRLTHYEVNFVPPFVAKSSLCRLNVSFLFMYYFYILSKNQPRSSLNNSDGVLTKKKECETKKINTLSFSLFLLKNLAKLPELTTCDSWSLEPLPFDLL